MERVNREKLIDLMAEKGLTQDRLAQQAGVSRTALYGMLSGHKSMAPTLGRVAKALGVRPSELLDI